MGAICHVQALEITDHTLGKQCVLRTEYKYSVLLTVSFCTVDTCTEYGSALTVTSPPGLGGNPKVKIEIPV